MRVVFLYLKKKRNLFVNLFKAIYTHVVKMNSVIYIQLTQNLLL